MNSKRTSPAGQRCVLNEFINVSEFINMSKLITEREFINVRGFITVREFTILLKKERNCSNKVDFFLLI